MWCNCVPVNFQQNIIPYAERKGSSIDFHLPSLWLEGRGPSFPVWEHSSSTQFRCSHQYPVPAEEGALSFLCPPLTKVLISCTTTFSEGAMCPANNWHSVVSVSPNGIWVPIECDPCRSPQALGH
ncbi:unnamed protein product [Rangifer tarandus platyrhynchus]|uniref:Uncharacterized protein n=1 Tax=Rangifer tarandus platyrhynchus TaxID=3082113 RepID=A0ABN9A9L4_RANTA|nr:unnamed protein product [Rangifer tarandus platyrhynchus]